MISLYKATYRRAMFKRFGRVDAKSSSTPTVDNNNGLIEGAVTSEAGETALSDSRTKSCCGVYSTSVLRLDRTLYLR